MLHIVLGVTGGIAAYKATGLIRLFTKAGDDVKVIPTENALRFIGATTLEALSHNTVDSDLYTDVADVKHVNIGQQADLIVVAPATANFIAKIAAGIADDLLGNTILASNAPILIAPAMHSEMWLNPATVANIAVLKARGYKVLEPVEGRLTGEDSGIGRLPDSEQIYSAAMMMIGKKDLVGKRILVTAGGTQEEIDPVRYIGNRSSGKQGVAIAMRAAARGAEVTLIGANIAPVQVPGIEFISVRTASDLDVSLNKNIASYDALIQAAAISDFKVANPPSKKIKRGEHGDSISLDLVANPDILAGITKRISAEGLKCRTVGFAAETVESAEELVQLGKMKLTSKGCDMIVANDVSNGKVFDLDTTSAIILSKQLQEKSVSGSKTDVANAILDILFS